MQQSLKLSLSTLFLLKRVQYNDCLFLWMTKWIFFLHFCIISDIAEKFHWGLSKEEINQITTKYDFKKNGKFAYCDFLQSCILLLKPQKSSLLQRVIIQKPQKPVQTKHIKIKITFFFFFLLFDSLFSFLMITLQSNLRDILQSGETGH